MSKKSSHVICSFHIEYGGRKSNVVLVIATFLNLEDMNSDGFFSPASYEYSKIAPYKEDVTLSSQTTVTK